MEASGDANWLRGEASWWQNSDAEKPYESNPPNEWDGWKRQRFRPPLSRFVFAPAWSIALLVASTFPLIFPGNTPDDQTVALALFVSAFALLIGQAMYISYTQPDGSGLRMKTWLMFGDGSANLTRTLGLFTLASVAFVAHILVDVRIGWLAFALFGLLWLHLLLRTANALAVPCSRWLAPVNVTNLEFSSLSSGWELDSQYWRRGRIAHKPVGGGRNVELYGVSRAGADFVAVHLRHPSGIVYDPFSKLDKIPTFSVFGLGICGPRLEGVENEFSAPPLAISVARWPDSLIAANEEE